MGKSAQVTVGDGEDTLNPSLIESERRNEV